MIYKDKLKQGDILVEVSDSSNFIKIKVLYIGQSSLFVSYTGQTSKVVREYVLNEDEFNRYEVLEK